MSSRGRRGAGGEAEQPNDALAGTRRGRPPNAALAAPRAGGEPRLASVGQLDRMMRTELAKIREEMDVFVQSILKQMIAHQHTLPRAEGGDVAGLKRELHQLRESVARLDNGGGHGGGDPAAAEGAGAAEPLLADRAYVRGQLERELRVKLHVAKQQLKREGAAAIGELRSTMRSRLDATDAEVARLRQGQSQLAAGPPLESIEARLRALEETAADMRSPESWTEHTASNGQVYFHHPQLNVSSWTRPGGPPSQTADTATAVEAALQAEKAAREAFEAEMRVVAEELRQEATAGRVRARSQDV
eukprot:COSAG01_NODE_20165_length_967_cov_1.195853_1_plen_302_part_10